MKIRQGFVSNSSSSSFTCLVTGRTESGWDMGLEETGMYKCEKKHIFLHKYILELDNEFEIKLGYVVKRLEHSRDYKLWIEKYPEEVEKAKAKLVILESITEEEFKKWIETEELEESYILEDWGREIPPAMCPICTLQYPTDGFILIYLLNLTEHTREQAVGEIQGLFKDYDVFMKKMEDGYEGKD